MDYQLGNVNEEDYIKSRIDLKKKYQKSYPF